MMCRQESARGRVKTLCLARVLSSRWTELSSFHVSQIHASSMIKVLKYRHFRLGTLGKSYWNRVLQIEYFLGNSLGIITCESESKEVSLSRKKSICNQDHQQNSPTTCPLFGWGDKTFYIPTTVSHWMLDTLRMNTNIGLVGFLWLRQSLKALKIDMGFLGAHISCKAENRTKNPNN